MSAESQYNDEPSFGKPLLIGAILGFVTLAAGCIAIGLSSGYDVPGTLGIAVFAAAFGGVGFGCMFGAVYAITRPADAPDAHAVAEPEGAAATTSDAAQAA